MKKINAIIEINKHSRLKYEFNNGKLELDRIIEIPYPAAYGFIPGTLGPDGDPLDVFILTDHQLVSGSSVNLSVIGYIEVIDNGEEDHKIIGVIENDASTVTVRIDDVKKFLIEYKSGVVIGNFVSKKHAFKLIEESYVTPLDMDWDTKNYPF